MGFQGVYFNSIDAKGRASIPARFREQLKELFEDETLVVTQDRCGIVAYPVSEWDLFLEKFAQLPNDQFREDLYFTTVTPATQCAFDKQGRIQVPERHREFAGLGKDVTVVGAMDRIEIWSTAAWEAEAAEADEYYSGIEEVLSEDGGI